MSLGDLKAAIEQRDTAIALRKCAEASCEAALQREKELRAELDRVRGALRGEEARASLAWRHVQELQAQMTAMVEAQPHRLVHAFATEVGGTPPPGGPPRVPEDAEVRLRLRLIAEEFFETLWACFDADDPDDYQYELREDLDDAHSAVMGAIGAIRLRVDLVEAVDGFADQLYVVHGAALAFGVHMAPVFAEVHRSNMAKKGGPVVDGKLRKPPGWTPPDIEGELRKQGWEP